MNVLAKTTAAVIAAAALTGLGAGVASAAPAPPPAPQLAQGFHILNLTTYPMYLTNVTGDGNFEGRPDLGSELMPGQYADFEVQFRAFTVQNDDVTYTSADGKNWVTEHMMVNSINNGTWSQTATSQTADIQSMGSDPALDTAIEQVNNGPVTYDSTNAQQQADELKWLCTDPNAYATCTFDATSEKKIAGTKHQVGDSFTNNSGKTADYTISKHDSVGTTDSVDITATASAEFFELFDASVSAKYGHSWTKSEELDETVGAKVDPNVTVWLDDAPEMIRDTGNFHITIGGTTMNLDNVYFDSPAPDGNGNWSLESNPPGGATRIPPGGGTRIN